MTQDLDPTLSEAPYPFASHIGMQLTGWQKDQARVELELVDHHDNRHGNPHGGIHASLLDTAMGYAGSWTGDADRKQMVLTLSLTVNYTSRPKGSRLIAQGRRTGGGASTFFAEGTVTDETGEVIATGTGVFRYRRGG